MKYKTRVEINKKNLNNNVKAFRSILDKKTKLFAVVKSNAYGHGLTIFSKLADTFGVDGFCVDSVIEGLKLRLADIKKPIIVLGPSLTNFSEEAARENITITVSNLEALRALKKKNIPVNFHLKTDTGMHRQGFYAKDLPKALSFISCSKLLSARFTGMYTHFANAKNLTYPDYTLMQIREFEKAKSLCQKAGFKNLIFHASATGGALLFPKSHYDIVRVGIGLYGHWPTKESFIQHSLVCGKTLNLKPVLGWKSVVSEIKYFSPGDFIGYDLTERVTKPTRAAIIPVGYWHGIPRSASSKCEVLINGERARILGRVSMDMITVALARPKPGERRLANNRTARVGDIITIIGNDKKKNITAEEFAEFIGTINYEALTRINPLIKRIIV